MKEEGTGVSLAPLCSGRPECNTAAARAFRLNAALSGGCEILHPVNRTAQTWHTAAAAAAAF